MKAQSFISKAATLVVFASLATAVAPAFAAGPGGGDSGSESALGGANATGNKTVHPGAGNNVVANKMGNMPKTNAPPPAPSGSGSTTGSGMGGSGTTESNPANTK